MDSKAIFFFQIYNFHIILHQTIIIVLEQIIYLFKHPPQRIKKYILFPTSFHRVNSLNCM